MPLTISNTPGDDSFQANIELADSGTSVVVSGALWPGSPGSQIETALTGSPLTMPAAPATGFVYWAIEVNLTTGALVVIQSTVSSPVADPGCQIIFNQTLVPGSTDPALVATVTPNI